MTELSELSFEETYSQLERMVQRLEQGDLTLQEAIETYEWGIRLARHCGALLDAAELQVEELLEEEVALD
ncbi:MAG: exodeoxyribonuclease VII small subunit [Anaerolineae bacterium]|nr:exodeoxyribonuclease VII small subunit [Anaerolineae bacterium]